MLKKLITIALAVLFITTVFAGDTIPVKKFSRFYAGVSFTPGVSYRLLQQNKFGPDSIDAVIQKEILEGRKKNEIPQFGYSIGFKAGMRINRFLSVESGIEYASISYKNISSQVFYITGNWNGSSADTLQSFYSHYRYTYHYLNIPLGVNFLLGKKRVQCAISTGVNLSVFIKQTGTVYTYYDNGTTSKGETGNTIYKFTAVNMVPYLSVGINYCIHDLMVLRVMPTIYMQALKNINTPITEHLYGGGLNMSLLFNLPKVK